MTGRAGAADEVLVRRLFGDHGGALVAYAIRLTGDRTPAEEVVQEVLARAVREPESLAGDKGAVRARLFTVTRRLAAARPRTEATEPEPAPAIDSVAVLSALEALPRDEREVLRALYFQGRDVDETAATLGVEAGAVKSRTYHALHRLREMVVAPLPGAAG
ncbi:sigma factor-like helix-turn-helix DNA-binding protein [Paractinoplanes rishiriensis]|uniref:DNA-directed RNA polymerase sigma-70 factor n=1 Tax=Paractinoplanes rishiriensis TaxID=1050105 RepID=A0A919K882_9ACTN|nr:sigma factor-like helix-turn-helix DNA-binding protein [Actinoplanes rishiriensis]GIF00490.1 DNA-directed RNA polymerase sigma-70 factor [Actinoplanes rishiriensis]